MTNSNSKKKYLYLNQKNQQEISTAAREVVSLFAKYFPGIAPEISLDVANISTYLQKCVGEGKIFKIPGYLSDTSVEFVGYKLSFPYEDENKRNYYEVYSIRIFIISVLNKVRSNNDNNWSLYLKALNIYKVA